MTEFEQCLRMHLCDVRRLNIGNRADRKYYEGYLLNEVHSHVFVKLQTANIDDNKIQAEKQILRALDREVYEFEACNSFTYIASRFFEGYRSLRDVILDKNIADTQKGLVIENVFQKYISLLRAVERGCLTLEKDNWLYSFRRHSLKLLVTSGWNGCNSTIRLIWEYMATFYALGIEFLIRMKLISIKPISRVIHGDFHWNNVLCKFEDLQIIDVENISSGDPNIDIAFFYARLWYYCKKNDILMESVHKGLNIFKESEYYCENNYLRLQKLFKHFTKVNPRFR